MVLKPPNTMASPWPRLHPPSAFSRETLLQSRWLLSGVPRGVEGIWYDVLIMTEGKQQLFLQRVLFSFDLAKRKAGKAQILRMSTTEWQQEADICCLGGYVLEKMRSARTSDNLVLFKKTTTDMVRSRFIEGCLGLDSILVILCYLWLVCRWIWFLSRTLLQ